MGTHEGVSAPGVKGITSENVARILTSMNLN